MSKTCANCLYWSKGSTQLPGWGDCAKTDMHGDKPSNPPTTAIARGENWQGWLETAPTHSCSMWEAKE